MRAQFIADSEPSQIGAGKADVGLATGPALRKNRHIAALDGLRFLAAASILLGHGWHVILSFKGNDFIAAYGAGLLSFLGMPLFFVLSGFVIHYNYRHVFVRMNLKWAAFEFFGARFARLYPLYIASVLLGFSIQGIYMWIGPYTRTWFVLLLHDLTMTQSWFYHIMFGKLMLYFGFGVGWSIATEWFFYLGFVALVLPLSRLTRVRDLFALAVGFCALTIVLFAILREPVSNAGAQILGAQRAGPYAFGWWLFYFSPYVRIFEFVLGCITAQTFITLEHREPSAKEARVGLFVCLMAVAILLLCGLSYTGTFWPVAPDGFAHIFDNFGLAPPIAVIIFCVSRYSNMVSRLLASRTFVFWGERSYSIYAVHVVVVLVFSQAYGETYSFGHLIDALLRLAFMIALVLLLSSATYKYIEVPGRSWIRAGAREFAVRILGKPEGNALKKPHSTGVLVGLPLLFAAFVGLCILYQLEVIPLYGK